ncbi:LOW QUALITY PROTEIN: hypothetical protein ACHAWF_011977, partial [Thalassiosira exigua]
MSLRPNAKAGTNMPHSPVESEDEHGALSMLCGLCQENESGADTVFIKHAHLMQPILTKKDAVVAAAKKLNATLKCTVPKESHQYQSLQNFADMFEMMVNEKTAAKVSKAKTNGIRKVQSNDPILPEHNEEEEEDASPRVNK